MKTLKLFALLIVGMLLGQHVNAQDHCAEFYLGPLHTGYDSIVLLPINLASADDSAAAILIIDYGDGTVDTTSSFDTTRIHGYANEQEYIICLTYISPGCNSTYCDTIDVVRCPTQPYSIYQGYIEPGKVMFQVNGASTGIFNWNFGSNATPATATTQLATVIFTGTGLYNASVDVTVGGCTQTVPFVVNMLDCVAAIDSLELDVLNLNALAGAGTNYQYTWDVDGQYTWAGRDIQYTFNDFKPFQLCLNTTSAGCRDTVCTTVTPTLGQDSVYGYVFKNGEPVCDVWVYVMQQVSPGVAVAIDSTYGVYSQPLFQPKRCGGLYVVKIPTGNYFIKARLDFFDNEWYLYAPTYYGDDTLITDATPVTNNSNSPLVINLVPYAGTGVGIADVESLQAAAVYPNPTADKTVLSVTAKQSGVATLQLADVTGRIVQTTTANLAAGNNELDIDMSSQANGLYYVSVNDGTTKLMLKLLKAK